jgi:hypothetical protein
VLYVSIYYYVENELSKVSRFNKKVRNLCR